MNERDLVITITGTIARGTSRPVAVSWSVKASADETAEEVGKAVTIACRELNAALKETLK